MVILSKNPNKYNIAKSLTFGKMIADRDHSSEKIQGRDEKLCVIQELLFSYLKFQTSGVWLMNCLLVRLNKQIWCR